MGCVSSKLVKKELEREILCGVNGYGGGEYMANHVVSLTSTTYGALKLDSPKPQPQPLSKEEEEEDEHVQAEVINAWELMGDLEEETLPLSIRGKKSPKTLAGSAENKGRSPFKRFNIKSDSPKKVNKLTMGKENTQPSCNSSSNVGGKVGYFTPQSQSQSQRDLPEKGMSCSSRRKSLNPLFDPELVEAYEKELYQQQQQLEEEQIKKIISQTPSRMSMSSSCRFDCHLDDFESKCPPGGEDSVVIYTTTLRGIRKTFEECNTVRSMLESHQIRMYERDLSMDSGFKEELRKLMGGAKEVRIPLVFVKGRLIGGAQEVFKLEEEGKLGSLLHQIPRNSTACVCQGCGGIRFIMCLHCNGSCKVLDEDQINTIRCGDCNENGLLHCPLCC